MKPPEMRYLLDAEEFLRGIGRRHPLVVHSTPWPSLGGHFEAASISGTPLRVLVDVGEPAGRDAVCFCAGSGREARSFIVIRPGEGRVEVMRQWGGPLLSALAHVRELPRRSGGALPGRQRAPA